MWIEILMHNQIGRTNRRGGGWSANPDALLSRFRRFVTEFRRLVTKSCSQADSCLRKPA